jgi:hypothetical protein
MDPQHWFERLLAGEEDGQEDDQVNEKVAACSAQQQATHVCLQ